MRRPLRRLGRAGVLALVLVGVPTTAGPAHAAAVPYDDYSASGSIGFCDQSGHPVVGGLVDSKPFVWKAVGTVPAPAPYNEAGRKATLVAYQPRPRAYPNQWSGDTLTASTSYSNPTHPTAVATFRDFSLRDFIREFPPLWDGLIQLRLYYGLPNHPTWTQSYPAADIKVTGSTWSVVSAASVPCNAGTAVSAETVVLGTASPTPPPGSTPSPGAHRSTSATAAPAGSTSPTALAGPTTGAGSGSPSGGSPVLAVGLAALVVVGGAGTFWWRRRGEL